ncbi:MAG: prohibitin family protein [Pseudanabaenaceae cyanobacterium SKYGB_i_bin29]|nr:prohibitin family protein [Pseudanabaenaceae cyanobacterium SKYG29]MDW8420795.1 prohibitin family protein [Pseudanabaenaceae cyanobacterium SKYGB_i_bin29]
MNRYGLGLGVATFMLLLLPSSFRFVGNGENQVVFSRLRGVQPNPLHPGFHMVMPLFTSTYSFDVKTRALTWKENDPSAYDAPLISLSRDGQEIRLDLTVQYQVVDAVKTFNSLGLEYEDYIAALVRSAVYSETGAFSAQALYSTDRPILQSQIREAVTKSLQPKGIQVRDLLIRDVGFSKEFVQAIEAKTIAENQLAQKEFEIAQAKEDARAIISQARAEAGELKAKADALNRNPEYLEVVKSKVFGDSLDTLVTK